MTIAKAIEILKDHTPKAPPYFDPDLIASIKLGIEALKRVREMRVAGKPDRYSILPGETED